MNFFEALVIILVSVASGLLIFYRVSILHLHQLTTLTLIITLLYISRSYATRSADLKQRTFNISQKTRLILISLTAFLTQLVVISTGGFYSPLLIIIHLYTLGSSFLLHLTTSIIFLVASLGLISGQIFWDQKLLPIFKDDPGTVILYFASFIIIIPLSQFIMSAYHIKDNLSKVLHEYLKISQRREESVLSGLNELVFFTNVRLQIISVNEAVEHILKLQNTDIINKPIIEVLPIFTREGLPADESKFPIESILFDKATRIVKDLDLITPTNQKLPVIIQIKPVIDSKGVVNQLIFIITDERFYEGTTERHKDLQDVLLKHQQFISNLRKTISSMSTSDIRKMVEVLTHIEEDLRIAIDLEDHPIKNLNYFEDIAYLSEQSVLEKIDFAKSFGVNLSFFLPTTEISERAWLDLKNLHPKALGKSSFTVSINSAWFKLLIQKILDMGILIASESQTPKVELVAVHDNNIPLIQIIIYTQKILQNELNDLFVKHYGELTRSTNLKLGSGLEGFIAKSIATELNIPVSAQIMQNPPRLVITINAGANPITKSQ